MEAGLMASHPTGYFVSSLCRNPIVLFAAEAVNSAAATLLTVGLPFYMNHRFGWGARENFATAACQGMLYVLGALSAKSISRHWRRESSLLALYADMTVFAIAVGFSASLGWAIPTALLVIVASGLMGASWPMLESLVSAAGDPSRLSRRLGSYNIVWATTGAITLAACGAIIQHAPAWAFFGIVASAHLLAGGIISLRTFGTTPDHHGCDSSASLPEADPLDALQPVLHEDVARQHRLSLWLSRIALPSTYVVIFGLAPALPSLHIIKQLSPAIATLVASIWFIARAVAFLIAGNTTFWHRRPVLMLAASITMLIGFLGTIVAGSLPGMGHFQALLAMAAAQIVLGFSIGTIYSASLYFGMAMSEGSTEHGGYHEALIGLGQVLGPLVGATMQWIHPGAIWPAALGISAIIAFTVAVESAVGMRIAGGFGALVGRNR
jgi:MFS family permease